MKYEDDNVRVGENSIVIKRYGAFGSPRTIAFRDINAVNVVRLGSVGKWRLVGAGPGGGIRNWYGWDRSRGSKETALSLDVSRFWRPTITPDDPESFVAALPTTISIR